VHLASHFTFEPGDEANSFLLMGKGEVMTLKEMKTRENLFAGVDLLTLSACNTAAQQSGANGREIDGFAELAQRLGAGAVLATLWPVSDKSTPGLMGQFYKLRQESQGMTKAEALQKAQVAMLQGSEKVKPLPVAEEQSTAQQKSPRTDIVGLKEASLNAPRYQLNPKARFAHPYYWAGFVLIGNYL
jgi:CHAT domain-containing protein